MKIRQLKKNKIQINKPFLKDPPPNCAYYHADFEFDILSLYNNIY